VCPRDLDVHLEVRCAKITHEVDPFELLELHLEQSGATVVERAPVWGLAGQGGQLLVHRPIDGGQAATLARAEKDGELVYFVFAHTTVNGFAERAEALRDAVRSFRLLHPKGGLAEPLLPGGARMPIDHGFLYPASFRLDADKTSNAALAGYELEHKQLAGRGGIIVVVVIARREAEHEDPHVVGALAQRALHKRGIELPALDLVEVTPLDRRLPTHAASGAGRYRGAQVETELVIARDPQAWVVLARATPSREINGPAWVAGRRAFAIVRERFATSHASQDS